MDNKEVLKNWLTLNAVIQSMNETDAANLLRYELRTQKRKNIVFRLHSRFNRMRAARERKELNAKFDHD